jgi:hypothetical protein
MIIHRLCQIRRTTVPKNLCNSSNSNKTRVNPQLPLIMVHRRLSHLPPLFRLLHLPHRMRVLLPLAPSLLTVASASSIPTVEDFFEPPMILNHQMMPVPFILPQQHHLRRALRTNNNNRTPLPLLFPSLAPCVQLHRTHSTDVVAQALQGRSARLVCCVTHAKRIA